jgi:hypothetical protein
MNDNQQAAFIMAQTVSSAVKIHMTGDDRRHA